MWQVLAAVFAAVFGLGAGSSGLGSSASLPQTPVDTYSVKSCYSPEQNVKLTLNWPDNFIITDNRFVINPTQYPDPKIGYFPTPINYPTGGEPPYDINSHQWRWDYYKSRLTPVPGGAPKLNPLPTAPVFPNPSEVPQIDCKEMMLMNADNLPVSTRTYIRVRRNLRVASCKVDEMSGPYNGTREVECGSVSPQNPASWLAAAIVRGTCSYSTYGDLRKVADIGSLEIFWVPFTHNVKCRFNPEVPNCHPEGVENTNMNLKDFIYVLNSRDAYDPANPSNCRVRWDAGSTDKGACSHYFDVYIAEDVYNKMQEMTPPYGDDQHYFLKQVMENCQEQDVFMPLADVGFSIPPNFMEKPFVGENDFYPPQDGKIKPDPADPIQVGYYKSYIIYSGTINYTTTSLVILPEPAGTGGVLTTDHILLGSVYFKKSTNEEIAFRVYSHQNAPNTFLLQEATGNDPAVYQYTITDSALTQNYAHSPSLQFKSLEFSTENEWTWATPVCKPAIYLYPEKPTEINVKLNIAGNLTASIPAYDPALGWNVKAYPDGTIQQLNNETMQQSTTYPYLYYEADVTGITIPKEGWVIEASGIRYQVSGIMKEIGFNEKEITDFLDYWQPRLEEKPYYFVTLLPEEIISEKENLSLSLNPDTIIRTRVIFEGLDGPLSVMPLKNIPRHDREGFVLTDWGGALVGKSCTDITVH